MDIKNRHLRRILIVEKMIMMPVKAAFLLFSFLFFWVPSAEFHILSRRFLYYQTALYITANVIFFIILTWAQRREKASLSIRISAFFLSIIDNLYLSFLIPMTGGLESPLYWMYSGLMIRNAVNFPKISEQGIINLAFCFFYGGVVYLAERESDLFFREVFYLRIVVLVLVSICCWGIYALIQQRALKREEERELQLRREKIHAVRRLAGEIAHGLKNPLSIMYNAAYYLERHAEEKSVEIQKHLHIIREEVERSDKILNQIMDYAKLSNVKLAKLNVNQVLTDVIEEIHFEAAYPKLEIRKKFRKDIPLIFFDEGHLRQILQNLVINAAEAILAKGPEGVITLMTYWSDEDVLNISISDTGIGMDESAMNKIYNPFFTTKEKGTGLGLSIVKNLLQTYDGSIEVESRKGEGSTFVLKLPIRTIVE
ncbi:MAG: GHKL domain-containing protein [Chlamydiae bacterium]|nr:GHKL domain-containing protein [Chlamydiota bacterium]MBI3266101.1 GHKL domain-containing protein [Chlamydiota bacterium]